VIIGRLVLLAMILLAVYLPLRGWVSFRPPWRFIALLPALPLLGLVGLVIFNALSTPVVHELSPEMGILVVISSLVLSAVVGMLAHRGQ